MNFLIMEIHKIVMESLKKNLDIVNFDLLGLCTFHDNNEPNCFFFTIFEKNLVGINQFAYN